MKVRSILVSVMPAITTALVAALVLATAGTAHAGLSDSQKCLDGKHKAAGKHAACLIKVLASSVGEVPDNSRCDDALGEAFGALEAKYGSRCRTSGDAGTIMARNQAMVDALDVLIDATGAGSGDALACALTRLKAAGRRVACGAKAQGLLIKKNLFSRDVTTCNDKLDVAFDKAAEAGACTGSATAGGTLAAIDAAFAQIEADLADLGTEDYADAGRFKAARQTVTFVDTSRGTDANGSAPALPERTIPAEIYYPGIATSVGAPFAEIGGPYPVIIRAHGFSGFRNDSTDLTRHLASHGYIVVSPEFPLSNLNTPGGATLLDLDEQVVDIGFLLTQIEALNAEPGGFWQGHIDTSRVGLVGHSLGGATVLGAAFHPTLRDSRIDAVVALAPFACMYQETFFDGGGTVPTMIIAGDEDMITRYTSNHLDVYTRANAAKYLMTLDGGTHIGFANNLLNLGPTQNGDEVMACPIFLPPGAERPYLPDFGIPSDFMGGAAAGVDTTGSTCEPLCPPPPAEWMLWDRQTELELAGVLSMLERELRGSVSADRMITERLDTENDDVTLAYER